MKNVFTQAQAAMKHLIKHSTHKHRSGKGVVMEATRQLLNFSLLRTPLRLTATLCFLLTVGVGNMWGETITLTLSDNSTDTWTNQGKSGGGTAIAMNDKTVTGISLSGTSGYCNTSNKYTQIYSGSDITITSTAGNMTSVAFTCTGSNTDDYSPSKFALKSGSAGSYSKGANGSTVGTWTGNATSFTLHANAQVRVKSITVTYTAPVAEPYTVRFYTASGIYSDIEEASVGAGVIPPVMSTPCEGWAFQGWSITQSTSSTSTTVLTTETLTDGKYYPSANTTLYPVYTKAGTASTDLIIVPASYTSKGTSNYGSGAERTASVDGVSFGAHYITGNAANSPASGKSAGTYIQCQASNANIYNKSAFPGSITKVVVNQYAAQAFSLYCGSSQLMASNNTSTGQTPSGTAQSVQTSATQMTWNVSAASSYTYFDIKKGSGTSYISSIVITYLAPVTYYYSYPTCCTPLGTINGSINLTTRGTGLIGAGNRTSFRTFIR